MDKEPLQKKTKKEELDAMTAEKKKKKSNRSKSHDILTCLKREIAVLEMGGERPRCLDKIYRAMITCSPSSVEAERSFNAAGLFVTKLRSSLSDNSIDKLCLIRSHLMQ